MLVRRVETMPNDLIFLLFWYLIYLAVKDFDLFLHTILSELSKAVQQYKIECQIASFFVLFGIDSSLLSDNCLYPKLLQLFSHNWQHLCVLIHKEFAINLYFVDRISASSE